MGAVACLAAVLLAGCGDVAEDARDEATEAAADELGEALFGDLWVKDAVPDDAVAVRLKFCEVWLLRDGEPGVQVLAIDETVELLATADAPIRLGALSYRFTHYDGLAIGLCDGQVERQDGTVEALHIQHEAVVLHGPFDTAIGPDVLVDFDLAVGLDSDGAAFAPAVGLVKWQTQDMDRDGIDDFHDATPGALPVPPQSFRPLSELGDPYVARPAADLSTLHGRDAGDGTATATPSASMTGTSTTDASMTPAGEDAVGRHPKTGHTLAWRIPEKNGLARGQNDTSFYVPAGEPFTLGFVLGPPDAEPATACAARSTSARDRSIPDGYPDVLFAVDGPVPGEHGGRARFDETGDYYVRSVCHLADGHRLWTPEIQITAYAG